MWTQLLLTAGLMYTWYKCTPRQKYRFKTVIFGSDIIEGICLKKFFPKDTIDKIYLVNVYTDNAANAANADSNAADAHINTNGQFLVNCSFDSVSVRQLGFEPWSRSCQLTKDLAFKDFSGQDIDLELFYVTISEI